MSIIQTIRDKATWFISIIIGLSLVGFLLMDAGKASGRMREGSTFIGSVNGKDIDRMDYDATIKSMESQYGEMASYYGDMLKSQAWDQVVLSQIIEDEANKLGLSVSTKEIEDLLFVNPPDDIRKAAVNDKGEFDPNVIRQNIDALKKSKDKAKIDGFNEYLGNLAKGKVQQKFMSLLSNTTYYPKWLAEKINTENNSMAIVSYVNVPYSSPAFIDTAKVSDEEISSYVNKHKEEYKQELTRDISLVSFSSKPSSKDTAELINTLVTAKPEMAATEEKDMATFLAKTGSLQNMLNLYVLEANLKVPNADTIKKLPIGGVYGPYADQGNYVVAKMISRRSLADSVFCRHILFRTAGDTSSDSLADKRIDSVIAAINAGSDFVTVMKAVSDDKGAASMEDGIMKFSSTQMQDEQSFDKDFAQFALFEGTKGQRKKVKTKFGYHYIEVVDQKGIGPACKISYLSKPLLASRETEDSAKVLANQFLLVSQNAKSFKENAQKSNYAVIPVTDIKPGDENVGQFGKSRELVRWVYDASKGDISKQVFNIKSSYVVALVSEINPEGTQSVSRARIMVEGLVRRDRTAARIKNKIGTVSTLEAVASTTGQQLLKADSVSFSNPFFPNAGMESRVAGYAFSAAAKGKVSPPITGNGGIFVIRTESVYAKPNQLTDAEQYRKNMMENQRSMGGRQLMEALKKTAQIKDKRSEIY